MILVGGEKYNCLASINGYNFMRTQLVTFRKRILGCMCTKGFIWEKEMLRKSWEEEVSGWGRRMADQRGKAKSKVCHTKFVSLPLHEGDAIWPRFKITLEPGTQQRKCEVFQPEVDTKTMGEILLVWNPHFSYPVPKSAPSKVHNFNSNETNKVIRKPIEKLPLPC